MRGCLGFKRLNVGDVKTELDASKLSKAHARNNAMYVERRI